MVAGFGCNTGRVLVQSNDIRNKKNPYFAPVLQFNPRIFFGSMQIGIRAEYQYDVTKENWKNIRVTPSGESIEVDDYSHSGMNLLFSVGWLLE